MKKDKNNNGIPGTGIKASVEIRRIAFQDPTRPKKQVVQAFVKRSDRQNIYSHFLFNCGSGVTVLPETENGEIIALNEFYEGAKKDVVTVPGGGIDKNSSIKNAQEQALKELEQEIGAIPEKLIYLGKVFPSARHSTDFNICFLAKNCKIVDKQNLEDKEAIKFKKIPKQKFFKMVASGKVQDQEACAILAMAFKYLFPKQTKSILKGD